MPLLHTILCRFPRCSNRQGEAEGRPQASLVQVSWAERCLKGPRGTWFSPRWQVKGQVNKMEAQRNEFVRWHAALSDKVSRSARQTYILRVYSRFFSLLCLYGPLLLARGQFSQKCTILPFDNICFKGRSCLTSRLWILCYCRHLGLFVPRTHSWQILKNRK